MQFSQDELKWGVSAGGLAGFCYFLAVGGFFSILIAYAPFLPLLMVGLSYGARALMVASGIAILLAGLISGISGVALFALLYAVPSFIICQLALTRVKPLQLYPAGGVLTGLTFYIAGTVTLLILILARDGLDMSTLFASSDQMPEEWMIKSREILAQSPFLIFGFGAWIQILMIYGVMTLANFILEGWDKNLRRDFRLTPFMPSTIVLGALLVAGLASFGGNEVSQLAAKTAFIILLLPYFLMGIARLHQKAAHWPHKTLTLITIYAITALVFPVIFCFIGFGLYEQAKFLSNPRDNAGDR